MLNLANRTLSANTNRLNLGTRSLAALANVNIDLALVRRDQAQHPQPKGPDSIPIGKKPAIFPWLDGPSGFGWETPAFLTSLAAETIGGRGRLEPRTVATAETSPVVRPVVVDDRSTDRDRVPGILSHHSMRMYSGSARRRTVRAAAFSVTTIVSRPCFGG